MQSMFSAELCSATIHVVRLALPITYHVHLHKRWVEKEKGRSLNSTLMVYIAEIYNDEDKKSYISDWFFKLYILIRFDVGCFRSVCEGRPEGHGCRIYLAAFTFKQPLQILNLAVRLKTESNW